MRRENILVVGAGPAGAAAAVQCARLGFIPCLWDETGAAGGLVSNAFSVDNYPGLERPLTGREFAERIRAHLRRFDLHVEQARVTAVRPDESGVAASSSLGEVRARALILATGTHPIRLGVPGEEDLAGSFVFYDVGSLLLRLPAPQSVVVIGGGEAACDFALTLAHAGADVRMLIRRGRLRARGDLARAVLTHPRIHVLLHCSCRCIDRVPKPVIRCTSEETGDAAALATDAVLVAIGRRSSVPGLLHKGLGGTGTIADACRPGLFLVGDARNASLGQIGMAVGDGLHAASLAVAHVESTS